MKLLKRGLARTAWVAVLYLGAWTVHGQQIPPAILTETDPAVVSAISNQNNNTWLYPGSTFTVTAPGLVTMPIAAAASYVDTSGMSGSDQWSYWYIGYGGATGFVIMDPNGTVVGWLLLSISCGPGGPPYNCGYSVDAMGNSLVATGDAPYSYSASSTNSNVAFSGNVIAASGVTMANVNGSYAFYANTAGTYSIYQIGSEYNYYTGQGDENNVDSQDAANIESEWIDSQAFIGIGQITQSSAFQPPAGSLTITRQAGATGVTLNWSIMAPASSSKDGAVPIDVPGGSTSTGP